MCAIIKNFHQELSKMNEKEYIENFLIYNLSIVISGNKPSATVTLKKGENSNYDKWINYGVDFVKRIGLKYIALRESSKAVILLVYNEKVLESYIFAEETLEFLISIGYKSKDSLNNCLNILKERYNIYHCPHELGVFLGFPVNDVKDFMECTSKKCLMCGYWKVYNNLDYAVETFEKFDLIRKKAAQNIIYGLNSQELIVKLQEIC